MDMERSSMSSREGSPLKSNGAYTSRINSTDAGQRELHVVQQTAAAVSSDDERVENHCLTEEDTPREINQERTISEGGQNEIQTQLQEQVTPPSSSEPQTPHNGMFGDRHRPNGSAAGGGETHHEDNELAITGDTSTGHRSKGALTCMTLTRITGLVVLAIVIAGIFSVPIVLFALKTNKDRGPPAAECTAEVYNGEVCQSALAARQSCIPGRENSAEVFVTIPQSRQILVMGGLQQLPTPLSPDCQSELLPFLCVEVFGGFCDGTGTVHRTTRQECERITTTVCAAEFQLILPLLEAGGLETSCDAFPESSGLCSNTPQGSAEIPIPSNQPIPTSGSGIMGIAPDRNCSEDFFVDETSDFRLCTPECGEWRPLSDKRVEVLTIVTLTSGAIGLTLSLFVVLLSCLHYKTTFTFPGIFIFYQMLSSLVYVIVFVMTHVDFKALLCGSRSLVESLMPGNETPLCIISGAAWIYISHQVVLWWIFHLSMVFCAIFFPYKYHYWKQSGYFKYIHVVMVVVAIVEPIIPAIVLFKVDGYVLYFLIRPDCVARNSQLAFYIHVVPLIVAVAVGLYLLVLIFWKFFSEEWMCPKKPTFAKRQVEIKILFLLCCYCIVWSDAIAVNVATLIEAEDYRNALVEEFTCEAAGIGGCPQDTFERFDIISKTIAYALIGIYPAIFLIYFVKKRLHTCTCCSRTATTNSTGSSASAPSRNNIM